MTAPAVLFLCTHNAGRSQMALGFFTHLAGDRAVAWSGGSEPAAQINRAAVAAMAERGIDITGEYPKPWSDEMVRAADVVITMGCGDACPVFPGKRYEEWVLDDPHGLPVDDVRPIRDEIERRVRALLTELVPATDAAAAPPPDPSPARLGHLQQGTTSATALAFYDTLAPARIEEMIGSWRGEGLRTGHPFDGLLERFRWYGKRFDSPDDVHPLVFRAGADRKVPINPAFVPLPLLVRYRSLLRAPLVPTLFAVIRPLLSTQKPKARLRLANYRGVVTATMCYDALPISDAFRKVDDDTLVGAMDARGLPMPFLFVLRRE